MHKDNPTYFRLLLSVSVFHIDHESLTSWGQPSQKKSYLIYISLNYHSLWILAQKKNLFFPSQLWPKYASCFANLRMWDSWSQDGWCLPHILLPWLCSYHTGSITLHFHEQIPCTRCRQAHSNSQGWKGMFFQIQPHLPYSSALGKMHWSEPEKMGFLLIFHQPLGIAPSHN